MDQFVDKVKNFVAEKIANIKKPEATVTDVDLKSVHRDRVEYGAKLSVNNPYATPIPICQISYTLKSNSRHTVITIDEEIRLGAAGVNQSWPLTLE